MTVRGKLINLGSIVNNSRAFAASINAFAKEEKNNDLKRELVYRHLA